MKYPGPIRARLTRPMWPSQRFVTKAATVNALGAEYVVSFPTVPGLKLEIGALRVGAVSGEAGKFVQSY